MKYFLIQTGLRGGYMPDSSYPIRCETRRDLREAIKGEADSLIAEHERDYSSVTGLSDKAQATFAAWIWREVNSKRHQALPFALPYGSRGKGKPYAIFLVPITRVEFLEHEGE